MPIQFPKRRESDQQAARRVEKIKDHNAALGCDPQGNPVNHEGGLLKNFRKKDWEFFRKLK